MSRLETGTFVLHPKEGRLHETIAQAMSTVWGKAEQKGIELSVKCDQKIMVQHDPKWTAEAIGNILDNAVKYTPEGGQVQVIVRPWQFYTRIDIKDTGMGNIKNSITRTSSKDFIGQRRRLPRRAWDLGCIWQMGLLHGKKAISV